VADDSAIDFGRSSITWLLAEQPSYGRFAVDASLTLPQGETFFLCAQVYAGNVYGSGPLFKEPPYGFSAAFSATRYRIFRDAVRGPVLDDSFGDPAGRIRELHFDIRRRASAVYDPLALASTSAPAGPLSARVQIAGNGALAGAVLEFPVRHLNARAAPPAFQVETGPVLVAVAGSGDLPSRLRRAYVMIGHPNRAEFLVDSERRSAAASRWGSRLTVDCDSKFFSI
jgi:hypothetical protein